MTPRRKPNHVEGSCVRALWCVLLASSIALGASACKPRAQSAAGYTWAAPGAPAMTFEDAQAAPAAWVGGRPNVDLESAIAASARTAGLQLTGDERLARLALFCSERLAEDPTLPVQALADHSKAHLGLYDPQATVIALDLTDDALASELPARLSKLCEGRACRHYGAVLTSHGKTSRLLLVVSDRSVGLAPVPRIVSVGTPLRLTGTLRGSFVRPRIALHRRGAADQVLEAGDGPTFEVTLPGQASGSVEVVLLADGEDGRVVVATLPLLVGLEPPREITLPAGAHDIDRSAFASDVLARINAERTRAGLPSVEISSALSRLAERHARDMRDHDFIDDVAVRTGSPTDRVARSRAVGATGAVLEHVAKGRDLATMWTAAIGSARTRESFLARNITHVGIGAAPAWTEQPALYATWLLVDAAAPVEPAQAQALLLARINEARAQSAVREVAADDELARVATEAAEAFVHGGASVTERQVVEEANAKLQASSRKYSRITVTIAVVSRVEDAATLHATRDPAATNVGIGVAQGERQDRGGRVIAVVFALAVPR